MTAALTPALALDYLTALSADLRAAVILRATDGGLLAGPPGLREPAARVLAEATAQEGRIATGAVFAVRDAEHAIVAVTGPHALSRLTLRDLRTALAALGREMPAETRPEPVPEAAIRALLGAISTS